MAIGVPPGSTPRSAPAKPAQHSEHAAVAARVISRLTTKVTETNHGVQLPVVARVAGLAVREVEEEDADDPHTQVRADPGAADGAAHRSLERGTGRRHRVTVLGAGGAAHQRHLGDDRRAACDEDQMVVGVLLALDADEARPDGERPRLERPARVLAAGPSRQRTQVTDCRGVRRVVDLSRLRVGERLHRPALEAAGRAVDETRRFMLLPGLRAWSELGAVATARNDRGREGRGADDHARYDKR